MKLILGNINENKEDTSKRNPRNISSIKSLDELSAFKNSNGQEIEGMIKWSDGDIGRRFSIGSRKIYSTYLNNYKK